ncbi:type 4a pilus biogenesis protein PilO [Gracilibacillus oryzae]|uniref:Type 4a pilus biogenesis protein PilO n=1 Tax=Gracilibacillus oryzae TaxID=1672701 RepID=A0A7C8KSS1_9BACI|nr:type 4a pilus biogenesis protein PilO [Gracilibacillus oryzae]KAB8137500.1 type 4a pilus biogenesis protein PilO [Gracilibacillus oryzae]
MTLKWSHRKTLILIASLLIIISLAALSYYRWIYPTQQTLDQLQAEIDQQNRLIQTVEEQKQQLNAEIDQAEQLQAQLPLHKDISNLIQQLETIEQETSTSIVSITTNQAEQLEDNTAAEIAESQYVISLAADSYDNANRFLQQLTQLERIVEINQVEYAQSSPTSNLIATIGITTFFQPNLTNLSLSRDQTETE